MLPTEIGGFQLDRYVFPAALYQSGGDVCSFVCPFEPQIHADAFGVDLADLLLGVSFPPQGPDRETGPALLILAWTANPRPRNSLLDARLSFMKGAGGGPPLVQTLTIAGKSVTRVYHTFLTADYLYEYEDVLFVIYGEDHWIPPDLAAWTEHEPVPPDVIAAIEALP